MRIRKVISTSWSARFDQELGFWVLAINVVGIHKTAGAAVTR